MQVPVTAGLFLILLISCAGPQPFDVARSCVPPFVMEVQGSVQGERGQYQKILHEACGDGYVGVKALTVEEHNYLTRTRETHITSTDGDETSVVEVRESMAPGFFEKSGLHTAPHTTYGFSIRINGL